MLNLQGRLIHKASRPSRLVRVVEPRITWRLRGADLTLDDYLSRNLTTGLLIARGDQILVERYQCGRTDRHRLTSWSMAKTVTAMLVGIAIDEGRIRSVDDSWLGIGHVAVGMHPQGFDLQLTQYDERGWGATVRQLGS